MDDYTPSDNFVERVMQDVYRHEDTMQKKKMRLVSGFYSTLMLSSAAMVVTIYHIARLTMMLLIPGVCR